MENWKKEFILKNYKELTYVEIANIIDVSVSAISCFLKNKGICRYKMTALTNEEMQYIIAAFDNKETYAEIAKHIGVKLSTLAKFLNNLGLNRNRMKNPGKTRRLQQAERVTHERFVQIKKNKDLDKAVLQSISLRKTSKRRWESYEDSALMRMYHENISIEIIAVKLNRSDLAVKARLYKLLTLL